MTTTLKSAINGIRVSSVFKEERFKDWKTIGPVFFVGHCGMVVAECVCGTTRVVRHSRLRYGESSGCGCKTAEKQREKAKARAPRGNRSRVAGFKSWEAMHARCLKNEQYYAGRGIYVCERWKGSEGFWRFIEDMGLRPSPLHSIERIDNDGCYCPENCKWALPSEQANNRRNNHLVCALGKTQTVTEWANETGIEKGTLLKRLQAGWSEEKAVTEPVQRKRK